VPDAVLLCVDCEGTRDQIARVAGILESADVRASFFFTGETAAAYPDLVRSLGRTHAINSHTGRHANLRTLGKAAQREEIMAGRRTVEDVLGADAPGFRAPYHAINRDTVDILNEERFLFDASGLYYRYDMGRVIEIRPTWFREWTELYAWLRLPARVGWDIPRLLFPFFDPLVLPVHPHYTGRDDVFATAMARFIEFAKRRSAAFLTIPDYIEAAS
jgi:peptidoglycan/xylan/chitin deacetylase (PgdA/CDA1 family)